MAPASEDELQEALLVLSSLTKRSAKDEAMADVQLRAYTENLRNYPADIVWQVLSTWRATTFWPAWAELANALDRATAPRRAWLAALRWAAEYTDEDAQSAPTTPEARERMQALVEHHFPTLRRVPAA